MPANETTRLNRPWLMKMLIFFMVLVVVGCWGLYDAMVAYPQRGLRYASYAEYQYLDKARSSGLFDQRSVSVPDPKAELERLHALEATRATPIDPLRQEWLEALAKVNALTPANTTITNPDQRYADLKNQWTASSGAIAQPKKIEWYDLKFQWVFVAVGLGGALWMLLLFFGVVRKRYLWDPATQTLTLPDKNTLTPADIEDFDKRKWDKFLVFLKIKPTHPTLGGKELKLDLYRYAPLESWILDMERTAFPDRAEEATKPEPGTASTEAPAEPRPSEG